MNKQVASRCSYMNETKWRVVLSVIAVRKVPCRIKLLYHDYAEVAHPGAAVVTAYDANGQPSYLQPDTIWSASPKYWDSASIGPFRTREIDWLAMSNSTLVAIRGELPQNLAIVEEADQSVILGYRPA